MIDRQFKLSDVDEICGTLPMNITLNTVLILAAREIIYRKKHIGGTLVRAQTL